MDALHEQGERVRAIADFWRRIGALGVDVLILALVGTIIGQLLFDPLARMGTSARLIGFAIALAYFGIGNSRLRGGQTFGKQFLGVKVVDTQGHALSVPRSLLRYVVLCLPLLVSGLPFDSAARMPSVPDYALGLVVFGSQLIILYLYVFNRRTRQSLHDLVVGSYVVNMQSRSRVTPLPVIWRGHLVVAALMALVILPIPVALSHLMKNFDIAALLPIDQTLSAQPHVQSAQVTRNWISIQDEQPRYLTARLQLDAPLTEDETLARKMAALMIHGNGKLADESTVLVMLSYGYDLGIASWRRRHNYSFKREQLH